MKINHASVHEGVVRINNEVSTFSDLSKVTHIRHSLSACFNGLGFESIKLSNLCYVGNFISISANQHLISASFPKLTQASWISLSGLPSLRSFEAPNLLVLSHGFFASDAPQLAEVFISPDLTVATNILNTKLNPAQPFSLSTRASA